MQPLTYTLEQEDIISFNTRRLEMLLPDFRRFHYGVLLTNGLVALALILVDLPGLRNGQIDLWLRDGLFLALLLALSSIMLSGIFIPTHANLRRQEQRRIRKDPANNLAIGAYSFQADAAGIQASGPHYTLNATWEHLHLADIGAEHIYLVGVDVTEIVVPRRACPSAAEWHALQGMVKQAMALEAPTGPIIEI